MKARENKVLKNFKKKIAQRLKLYKLILFGSRARGDETSESDFDIIVVLEEEVDEKSEGYISECAWESGFDKGLVIAPLVFSRREWEKGPERYSLLAMAAAKDGVLV
jgi:predicted nucleotidyltransferase